MFLPDFSIWAPSPLWPIIVIFSKQKVVIIQLSKKKLLNIIDGTPPFRLITRWIWKFFNLIKWVKNKLFANFLDLLHMYFNHLQTWNQHSRINYTKIASYLHNRNIRKTNKKCRWRLIQFNAMNLWRRI